MSLMDFSCVWQAVVRQEMQMKFSSWKQAWLLWARWRRSIGVGL